MKQTPEQLDQTMAGIRAWMEGKPAEYKRAEDGVWRPLTSGNDSVTIDPSLSLRPKPEPKLRLWKKGEEPKRPFVIRRKDDHDTWSLVTGRIEGKSRFGLFMSDTNAFSDLSQCEYSLDGNDPWLPCGVMEESTC